MNKIRFLIGTAAALLAFCTISPATNLVTNGSFEADSCNLNGGGYRLGLSGSDMSGWFIPATDGVYPWCLSNGNSLGAGPTPYGNQWLVIGETGADGGTGPFDYTIQQTVGGLVPGQTYTLSFAIASEEFCCSQIEVSFLSGSSTGPMAFTAPAGLNWGNWATESMSFLATGSSATLQFKDLAVGAPGGPFAGADVGLDNVVIEGTPAVPEPATFLLFGSGLLGLADAVRRRLVN